MFAIASLASYASPSLGMDKNEDTNNANKSETSQVEWGSWAVEPGDSSRIYGSGIVGNDENILHELDQSNLLDYDPQLEGGLGTNLPVSGELATEPQLDGAL